MPEPRPPGSSAKRDICCWVLFLAGPPLVLVIYVMLIGLAPAAAE